MYQKGQLSLRLEVPTSGTEPSVVATRLGSLRPAYLCKCDENSDSIDCAGCTEMITSLDKYAIRATVPKGISEKYGEDSVTAGCSAVQESICGRCCDLPASSAVRILYVGAAIFLA